MVCRSAGRAPANGRWRTVFGARTSGVVGRGYARSVAGAISAAGSVAAGVPPCDARELPADTTGRSPWPHATATDRPRADRRADPAAPFALLPHPARVARLCAIPDGGVSPHALRYGHDFFQTVSCSSAG